MEPSNFQNPDWYRALTLTERIASLKSSHNKSLKIGFNSDIALRHANRWKSQPPFDKDSYFTQRLATENISEEEFLRILGEPIEAVSDRYLNPPAWLTELAQAFSRVPASEPMTFPEALKDIETIGFLEIIEPLINQGRDRLHKNIQALIKTYSDLPFNPDTIEDLLFINLPKRLLMMLSPTLVLELNVARLQGLLQGNTPQERFQSFVVRLRQPDVALSILQEYPVLARQLTICIKRWVDVSLEFLQRLCSDWGKIRTKFTPDKDPGVLTEISGNVGDSHRDGRSVVIAKFSCDFQIVYKPRSMSLDIHFQQLLHWINERGEHPPFRTLNILDRGTYGWVEFVEAQTCTSKVEIQRFYQRQGGYLAILYALEAVDFHLENLIASGEHPILLDLEALFHPRVDCIDLKQADQLANSMLNYSVYGTGLLPHRIWSNDAFPGVDISGLGATDGQLSPHEVPRWEGVGTDEMKLTRKRVEMPGAQNYPTFNGEKVNVVDYTEAIANGFTSLYHLLLQHRDELLAENGLLANFAKDTVRVIIRATRTYAMCESESFHPDVLRNALDRDRLLDRLWLGVEHFPDLVQLIPSEREDLLKGDIPIFTTYPESNDLWTSSGQQIVDFQGRPSLISVQHRVQQLSEDDLKRQLWIIRASLTSLYLSTIGQKGNSTYPLIESEIVADRDQLLATAQGVGDRLNALALWGEEDVSWIGLTLVNEHNWSLTPLGYDLYDGMPGVTMFLAYLGAITQEERYTKLARAALNTLRHQIERNRSFITQIGAFNGWGGLIYTFTHLGQLWQQPELINEAEGFVDFLPTLIEQDEVLDIIGGVAGCIGCLLTLYRCKPSERTLNAAIKCGDRLQALAKPMKHGIGWLVKGIAEKPLTGFSHGVAGIAWALLELAAVTGLEQFRTAAMDAIAYERNLFSPTALNWPDLRHFETSVRTGNQGQVSFMTAWCHGAPGIGLARLQCLPYLDDSKIRSEIDTALKTTLSQGFGSNHSLCHGDLGNLELLLQASEILGEPQLRSQVDRLAAIILNSIAQHGWLCGIPGRVESPGLMTGLAGIGFGLLRLAEPKRVPSVLVLEPPTLHEEVVKSQHLEETLLQVTRPAT
ncbi:type 2 lanthipeptide synthetase LanM family protein [Aetokthonos hydrillicola Thurmond2011]|uniref:Type 2 lanthipeptide synthetase LanM family protein n=1 Tax=Aetokthonos hydrillicola Thurmond2011 TaxID=2712845 RepID=A0AAP5M997_9CYAN|nr:type 2 lanthipeptide synthetase LanM family protein [Aetokthonos hydrillicola]MBO3462201.1 type 2 lantipeptide synthetase LanM [Aetokthonos hydrillicola CCALA 1050]MBW4585101.1 type 2 lantipeptide synthetase LanM family protein [Aetokthonos hydrillicola CCALA 1050]MDR9894139.1 type 2 lanthipeptide synthetase LanM family protein [Aetokthonos hydrillicola Thurmond2011]